MVQVVKAIYEMKRFSLLQDTKQCYVCGTTQNIHIHEAFYGRNRQNSIKDGCCVYLCGKHHNLSNSGVHFNHKLDLKLKQITQKRWCEFYGKTKEQFLKRYGKNYI